MSALTGRTPAATYAGLLQLPGGATASLLGVQDGLGASTALLLSTAGVKVSGTFEVTGVVTGVLPAQTGNAGKFLKTDGSAASWAAPSTADVSGLDVALAGKLDSSYVSSYCLTLINLSTAELVRSHLGLGSLAVESLAPVSLGGTGLSALGSPLQILRVNSGGTALEYAAEVAPGGSNKQLQYNSGGAFGGTTAVTYAASATHLSVTSQSASTVGVSITGATSQSVPVFKAKNSSGTTIVALGVVGNASADAVTVYNSSGDNVFSIRGDGRVTTIVDLYAAGGSGIWFTGRSGFLSSADGLIRLSNWAGTGFTRLQLGGTTSSFPALKVNGAGLDVRLADDSGYGNVTCGTLTVRSDDYPALNMKSANGVTTYFQVYPNGGWYLYGAIDHQSDNLYMRSIGGSGIGFKNYSARVYNGQAAQPSLTVVAATSQSANILEVQNSSNTVLAGVSSTGRVFAGGNPHSSIPAAIKMVASDASDAYFGAAVGGKVAFIEVYNGEGGIDCYNYESASRINFNVGGFSGGGNTANLKLWSRNINVATFDGNTLAFNDGLTIATGTTTGTKIGTSASQKLGFFNATPVVQPSAIADADGTLADLTTKFNDLKNNVLEALGLMAA